MRGISRALGWSTRLKGVAYPVFGWVPMATRLSGAVPPCGLPAPHVGACHCVVAPFEQPPVGWRTRELGHSHRQVGRASGRLGGGASTRSRQSLAVDRTIGGMRPAVQISSAARLCAWITVSRPPRLAHLRICSPAPPHAHSANLRIHSGMAPYAAGDCGPDYHRCCRVGVNACGEA